MPLKLATDIVTPPGGYRFRSEPLGRTFGGAGQFPTRPALRSAMRGPLQAASLPMPTDQEIDEWMCAQLPPGWCVDRDSGQEVPDSRSPNFQPSSTKLTFKQVVTATRTLGYWATHGRPRVPAFEAEQRASICVAGEPEGKPCRFNLPVEGCTGCNLRALQDAIASVVQGQSTTYDERLQGCGLCGCSLKAKIWLPLEIITKYSSSLESVQKYAPWCWQLRESEVAV